MSDSTALHGRRCNARTFPLRCKYCQAEVFYFTCDCGHQAVFDSLDIPWARHDCPEHRTRLTDPRSAADILLEPAYAEQVQRAADAMRQRNDGAPDIESQLPYHGAQTTEIGMVQQIVPEVDVYSRFRLTKGSMALAMLKSAGEAPYAQVTLDVEALVDEDHSRFMFLVGQERLKHAGVVTGDLVKCMLQGLFLNSQVFWICTELHNVV